MLIKVTSRIVGYQTDLWIVPDDTDLEEVLEKGIPDDGVFFDNINRDTDIMEIEEIERLD